MPDCESAVETARKSSGWALPAAAPAERTLKHCRTA
eukprot:CAMPEP_0204042764 /NCGR_PEP_ID=MMETSP0360-20130528/99328_1 /ASSEMBLY_ACC=CAM_ASM_000342 /TAXON_ID=268821 /ORGANISM="Scrippsiella Hangoei, Strain SHTV-5" /LENGTH=35 /DNA_ID= /DNA_START= /DNA_END= /DNA_ORIENTATION=